MLTILAPMRSPVKEPGPDINVIFLMSLQVLSFSFNLSLIKLKSLSAKVLPKVWEYSLSFSLRMVVSVDVSKYKSMI